MSILTLSWSVSMPLSRVFKFAVFQASGIFPLETPSRRMMSLDHCFGPHCFDSFDNIFSGQIQCGLSNLLFLQLAPLYQGCFQACCPFIAEASLFSRWDQDPCFLTRIHSWHLLQTPYFSICFFPRCFYWDSV